MVDTFLLLRDIHVSCQTVCRLGTATEQIRSTEESGKNRALVLAILRMAPTKCDCPRVSWSFVLGQIRTLGGDRKPLLATRVPTAGPLFRSLIC